MLGEGQGMPAFNFQGSAVLGIFTFLGTALLVALGLALAAILVSRGRHRAARRVFARVGAGAGLYAVTLLLFSAFSRERVLGKGEEKYFCEVDCHLAYSVQDVRRMRTLGGPLRRSDAGGIYHVVKLRTRFDPETISSRRPSDLALHPNPRRVWVTDRRGRQFTASLEAEEALAGAGEPSVPLTRPLRPGESYLTRLVFDLPVNVESPRLVLTEKSWPTRLLIGHENSVGHSKTSFGL